jgi:hypothetical protein
MTAAKPEAELRPESEHLGELARACRLCSKRRWQRRHGGDDSEALLEARLEETREQGLRR